MRVLVPGCGSGYEVESLARLGFTVTGLDYAPAAIARAQARVDALPERDARALYAGLRRCAAVDARRTVRCGVRADLPVRAVPGPLGRLCGPGASLAASGGSLFALFVQAQRPGAAEGQIQGPPYHCDIHGMRALFPAPRWVWPKPPYPRAQPKPGLAELMVLLRPAPPIR
jgi:SAM-dependent methyltransferase